MKKLTLIACVMFALLTVLSVNSVYAQGKKKVPVELKAKAVVASRGANPNIKGGIPKVDKEEPKSRGSLCTVEYYNHTGLYVNVYVDGYFKGTLAPYSSGSVTVYGGYTTIYCVSSGGTQEWSASGNCTDTYVYNLYYN